MANTNNAVVFSFNDHNVRTITKDGDPWFVASDICKALNISNHRDAIGKLDDDEKGVGSTDTLGGKQEVVIVSESGMYTLILRCRDAVTKGTIPHQFKNFVTKEVLPAIRKTGKYETEITPEQQSDLFTIVDNINPDGRKKGMIWKHFNRHFKIAQYRQLPASKFEEAKAYLIETFANGEYVEADMPSSLVDIKQMLTGDMNDPVVPFSDELQRAINTKSFEVAHEFLETFQTHLSRRIAYTCQKGWPNRYIDEPQALAMVQSTSIDTALTHRFYGLLTNVQTMAENMKLMTSNYSKNISEVLGKKTTMLTV